MLLYRQFIVRFFSLQSKKNSPFSLHVLIGLLFLIFILLIFLIFYNDFCRTTHMLRICIVQYGPVCLVCYKSFSIKRGKWIELAFGTEATVAISYTVL